MIHISGFISHDLLLQREVLCPAAMQERDNFLCTVCLTSRVSSFAFRPSYQIPVCFVCNLAFHVHRLYFSLIFCFGLVMARTPS